MARLFVAPDAGLHAARHIQIEEVSGEAIDELLEEGYAVTLWEPGG